MLKRTFVKKKRPSEDMSLQITSMADIFTIILVFLLKSYATGALTLDASAGLLLPVARSGEEAVDTLKVEISEKGVLVEGKAVLSLEQFEFKQEEQDLNGTSKTLVSAFETEKSRQIASEKKKQDPRILVLADQKTPYGTLKRTLTSAAYQGFTDFKLVVVEDQ